MINGIVNVYKEPGFTSHDVVAKLRGILQQKKIGHTGTLDPEARGVLPVCLGNATKASEVIIGMSKTYRAVGVLGLVTDTQDIHGTTIEENQVNVDKAMIREAIQSFHGEYDQLPPMYSALKVNGRKLYELAREGKTVERKTRRINIYNIDILNIDPNKGEFEIEVECSKGTYIRTLIHDIGKLIGTGACMKDLIRTRVGNFELSSGKSLDEIEEITKENKLDSILIRVDELFAGYEPIKVLEESSRILYNGNALRARDIVDLKLDKNYDKVRVYDHLDKFKAIYQYNEEREFFKPYKMFL